MSKSYVGMLHHLCPVCAEKNGQTDLVLDRRLRDTFEMDNYQMGDMCEECQEKFDNGYIALVEANGSHTKSHMKQEEAARTGRIFHIKREVFEDLFNVSHEDKPLVFIEPELGDILHARMLG